MHDVEGFSVKTTKLRIITKFAGTGKKHIGPNLAELGQLLRALHTGGLRWVSHHGPDLACWWRGGGWAG